MYVLALVAASLVSITALSAIAIHRAHLRSASDSGDHARARRNAISALDLALHRIRQDEEWRATPDAMLLDRLRLGQGSGTAFISDPTDADLHDDPADPIVVRAIGESRGRRELIEASVAFDVDPLASIGSGIHVGGDLTIATANVTTDAPIRANAAAGLYQCTVGPAAVESADEVLTVDFTGTYQSNTTPMRLPGPDVIDEYTARATPIDHDLLALGTMTGIALGPGVNPYGPPSAEGIYVIDCQGNPLVVRESRIVGTLVVLNASTCRFDASVCLESVAGLPLLLIDGNTVIATTRAPLDEAANGSNYNPPGMPASGMEDADTLDVYASKIDGLVYIDGNLQCINRPKIIGAILVEGNATLQGEIAIEWKHPSPTPDGFLERPMPRLTAGGIRRVVE